MKLNGKAVYFLLSLLIGVLAWQGQRIIEGQENLSEQLNCLGTRISVIETVVRSYHPTAHDIIGKD